MPKQNTVRPISISTNSKTITTLFENHSPTETAQARYAMNAEVAHSQSTIKTQPTQIPVQPRLCLPFSCPPPVHLPYAHPTLISNTPRVFSQAHNTAQLNLIKSTPNRRTPNLIRTPNPTARPPSPHIRSIILLLLLLLLRVRRIHPLATLLIAATSPEIV
jgi:hypothetical protein